MGEHGDVGGAVDAADAARTPPSGQAAITSSASGKRSRVANWERGSQTNGAPAGRAREPAERGRVVDRAEDDQPRRRRGHVDEQRHVADLAQLGALGPHQLLGRGERRAGRARRRPRPPLRRPVGAHEQLRARASPPATTLDQRGAAVARAAIRGELALRRSLRVLLDEDVDLAAAGQPDVPGLGVGDPEVQQPRLALAQHLGGRPRRRRPRRSRPETAPDTSPCSLTAIFAPGGRGAERFTPTTVAIATRSPRSVQARTSSTTSFTSLSSLRSLPHATGDPKLRPAPPATQRVAGHELVDVRQRRLHPARQRLVVRVRLERVEPDQPVRAARQARDLALELLRLAAIPAVGEQHHDRAAARAGGRARG